MTVKYSVHPPDKYKKKKITTDHFFRIDEGPFKGTDFTFGEIKITPTKDDKALIEFGFDILHSPVKRVVRKTFYKCISEILDVELLKMSDAAPDPEDIVPADTPTLDLSVDPNEFNETEIIK